MLIVKPSSLVGISSSGSALLSIMLGGQPLVSEHARIIISESRTVKSGGVIGRVRVPAWVKCVVQTRPEIEVSGHFRPKNRLIEERIPADSSWARSRA